jgi:segregation and condensation protein A
MSYKLHLDIFEGPLDLLLYLIKKDDINIYDIPITQVTDQYLEYIEMMKILDLEIIGDFLVMAATLMQIKSRMLLPPDPSENEQTQEDPREDLVRRLQEYQVFKEIAEQLKQKEGQRQDLFARKLDDDLRQELKDESKEVYFEANLFDLINAFSKALQKYKEQATYELTQEEFTVEQKIHDILHALLKAQHLLLTDLFGRARSRLEVVATFMAVLELIRLREIKVVQRYQFGDIEVVRNKDNVVPVATPSAEDPSSEETKDPLSADPMPPPEPSQAAGPESDNPPSPPVDVS